MKSGRVSGKKLERKKEEEKKEVQIEEGNGRSERDETERKNDGEIKRKSEIGELMKLKMGGQKRKIEEQRRRK